MSILLALAMTPATVAPRPQIHVCRTYLSELGINIQETAEMDGRVRSTVFSSYGPHGLMARVGERPAAQGVTLDWPGRHLSVEEPLNWAHGSLGFSPLDPMAKKERWTQLYVDRGGSIRTIASREGVYLNLIAGAWLATQPSQYHSPFSLPLDDLLAWGTGAPTLTLYHVAWRKPGEGAPRVIGTYRLDMAAVRAQVAAIRARVDAWRTSLGDRRGCPIQQQDDFDDVVVTEASAN